MEALANLVFDYRFGQLGTHDADGPAGVALELDDLVSGVDDLLVHLAPVLGVALGVRVARGRAHVSQSGASDVDATPDRHARIAVLADDVAASHRRDTYTTVHRLIRMEKNIYI